MLVLSRGGIADEEEQGIGASVEMGAGGNAGPQRGAKTMVSCFGTFFRGQE